MLAAPIKTLISRFKNSPRQRAIADQKKADAREERRALIAKLVEAKRDLPARVKPLQDAFQAAVVAEEDARRKHDAALVARKRANDALEAAAVRAVDAPARLEEQVRASAAPELAPLHELMARGRERVRRGTIVCPWGRARFAEWFLAVRETMRWCDAQCIEDHDPAAIRAQCEEAIERLGLASVADELESSGAPGATGNILPTPVVG